MITEPLSRTPLGWMKLALSRYIDFQGRSSRPEFIWSLVGFVGFCYIARKIDVLFSLSFPSWVLAIGWAIVSVPALAVLVRRLHDLGYSGWWSIPPLLTIGPVALLISNLPFMESTSSIEFLLLVLILWMTDLPVVMLLSLIWTRNHGDPGPNRYGSPPPFI